MTSFKRVSRRSVFGFSCTEKARARGGTPGGASRSARWATVAPTVRRGRPLSRAIPALVVFLSIAPLEAAILPGDVLVNDFMDSAIHHYRPDGTLVRTLSGTGEAWIGAAVTPDGNVVTTRRRPATGVNIFDSAGNEIASFDTPEVARPSDVSIFSDGTIAVNDQSNDMEVVLYRPDGSHIATWPLPIGAWGSTTGPDDTLWVTWYGGSRIAQLGRDGSLLRNFALDFVPGDVVVDPTDGTLWVSQNDGNQVFHLAADGSVLGSFPVAVLPGSFNAIGLALDGSLLVTSDNDHSELLNYSREGTLLGSRRLVSPYGTLFMTVVPVPEPSSLLLACLAFAGLVAAGLRCK